MYTAVIDVTVVYELQRCVCRMYVAVLSSDGTYEYGYTKVRIQNTMYIVSGKLRGGSEQVVMMSSYNAAALRVNHEPYCIKDLLSPNWCNASANDWT